MKRRMWSHEEVEFLSENYKSMTYREIGEQLSRSGQVVYNKAKKIGLSKSVSLEGKIFGRLKVVAKTNERRDGRIVYKCLCKCGAMTKVISSSLKSGNTRSCGCLQKEKASKTPAMTSRKRKELKGKTFGRLKVLRKVENDPGSETFWKCKCKCGNEKDIRTNSLLLGRTKSCGCLNLDRGKRIMGKNNPNYKPYKSNLERLKNRYELYGKNMKNWRVKVYEKDSWTCQVCARVGGDLNAHHLDSWDSYPEKRFEIDNGVTLCEEACHKKFHLEYGYGNNTKEQFYEFKDKMTV